ncbi:3-oxoacyl-[acyl-carrier-protein] synthase, KASII [Salinispira pacifica]|uniref:3-oxoacyl-[acyl-carrier-protein] synthase 2 n=1 Tax=Salinispira pacifica TaxID=1307761 RepID=V5WDJ3_9SPIO|nr:3-oxoacyl-[acyl-carrier-protein] synthase, KASII [Salinispira pacifica]
MDPQGGCVAAKQRRVVITGLGTVNPIGFNVSQFWENLVKGKSGARKAQNMDLSDFHVQIAAEIDLPDVRDYFTQRKMARRLDRHIILGHIAGYQAIKDAGMDNYQEPHRVGVLVGTGDGGLITQYQQINRMAKSGLSSVSPFYVSSVIPNSTSAMISMEFGFTGPSFSVNSACASSNHALGTAYNMIATGMVDAMVTGGTEAVATEPSMAGFGQIGALSSRNDDPETASRPFDKSRDGFVMGEGAGVLFLEELEHAKKRGAHIYAEISGFGFTSDAYDLVAPHPDGIGASKAIELAVEMAELNYEQLDFINCHGTSTPIGDKAECQAVNRAMGADLASSIPVNSTKSMTGHLIGAASAVEAVAGILSFEQGVIHHTINQFELDDEINYNVIKEPMEKKADHFLSNAFGFGGQNACVVFSRYS